MDMLNAEASGSSFEKEFLLEPGKDLEAFWLAP